MVGTSTLGSWNSHWIEWLVERANEPANEWMEECTPFPKPLLYATSSLHLFNEPKKKLSLPLEFRTYWAVKNCLCFPLFGIPKFGYTCNDGNCCFLDMCSLANQDLYNTPKLDHQMKDDVIPRKRKNAKLKCLDKSPEITEISSGVILTAREIIDLSQWSIGRQNLPSFPLPNGAVRYCYSKYAMIYEISHDGSMVLVYIYIYMLT